MWLSLKNLLQKLFFFFSKPLVYLPLTLAILLLINVVSLIYSNVDLFTIDIAEIKKENKKAMEKMELAIKKNYSINSSAVVIQNTVTYFFFRTNLVIFAFIQMIVLEILPSYLVKLFDSKKKYLLNKFFLYPAYFIAKYSPLNYLLPEEKIFSHNEEDLIRFINNLASKEIRLLEPKEAQLANLAFRLDDREIKNAFVPNEKTFFLNTSMKNEDLKRIWKKRNILKYPVLDEKGEFIGILNMKTLIFKIIEVNSLLEKEGVWTKYIDRKVQFMKSNTKLSEALEILKNSENHFSVVKKDDKIVGIVTLNDILSLLVGKINDEF